MAVRELEGLKLSHTPGLDLSLSLQRHGVSLPYFQRKVGQHHY